LVVSGTRIPIIAYVSGRTRLIQAAANITTIDGARIAIITARNPLTQIANTYVIGRTGISIITCCTIINSVDTEACGLRTLFDNTANIVFVTNLWLVLTPANGCTLVVSTLIAVITTDREPLAAYSLSTRVDRTIIAVWAQIFTATNTSAIEAFVSQGARLAIITRTVQRRKDTSTNRLITRVHGTRISVITEFRRAYTSPCCTLGVFSAA